MSANGNIDKVTFQGTYVVDSDCRGSMTFDVVFPFGVLTANADFVIDDDGAEVRAIIKDSGVVETRR